MGLQVIEAVLILTAFSSLTALTSADGYLSIWDENGYDIARTCVQEALNNYVGGGLWNGALGCERQDAGFPNDCVCRCDLRPSAESYISSVVKSRCASNTIDIQSGILLYNAYCATAVTSDCAGVQTSDITFDLPTTKQAPLSIWTDNGLDTARTCVGNAFIQYVGGGLWNGALGCVKNSDGQFLDACVCRCDIQSLGTSYISSYVKSGCSSNTIDIESGISIYTQYCAAALPGVCGPAPVITTTSSTSTSQASTQSRPSTSTPSQTSHQSSTDLTFTGGSLSSSSSFSPSSPSSSSSSPSSSSPIDNPDSASPTPQPTSSSASNSGLSRSEKIALGTGLSIPLVALILAVIGIRYQRKAARRSHEAARNATISTWPQYS